MMTRCVEFSGTSTWRKHGSRQGEGNARARDSLRAVWEKGVQRTARPTYEIQSHQNKRSMLSSKQVPEK